MTDIAELFARDPSKCSDQDIDAIIADYRNKHMLFKSGAISAGKPAKAKAPSGIALDLKALGL